MPKTWYAYTGNSSPFDVLSNYTKIDGVPGCSDGTQICAILAEDGGTNPSNISENLRRYIANGLTKFVAQPEIPVNSKIFATFKVPY